MSIIGLDWNSPTTQLLGLGAAAGLFYYFWMYKPSAGAAVDQAKSDVNNADNAEAYKNAMQDLDETTHDHYPYVPLSSGLLDH